jgi:hypothetical protein
MVWLTTILQGIEGVKSSCNNKNVKLFPRNKKVEHHIINQPLNAVLWQAHKLTVLVQA